MVYMCSARKSSKYTSSPQPYTGQHWNRRARWPQSKPHFWEANVMLQLVYRLQLGPRAGGQGRESHASWELRGDKKLSHNSLLGRKEASRKWSWCSLQALHALMLQEDYRVFCQDLDSAASQAWPVSYVDVYKVLRAPWRSRFPSQANSHASGIFLWLLWTELCTPPPPEFIYWSLNP